MKVGDLIRVHHSGMVLNGKVGVLMRMIERAGFRDSYAVMIPCLGYEVGLFIEQCEVINEGR